MSDTTQYAVFLFPQAIEALGAAIKPYLTEMDVVGPYIVCLEIDASGAFFELTVPGRNAEGKDVEAELMLPNAFVRLVVSVHNDQPFGFGVRSAAAPGAKKT
jgi:hypothetical protein